MSLENPKCYAPWSQAQVDSLNEYQASGAFHPFTHCDDMRAYAHGWICDTCGTVTRQTWAWEWMTNWLWKELQIDWLHN